MFNCGFSMMLSYLKHAAEKYENGAAALLIDLQPAACVGAAFAYMWQQLIWVLQLCIYGLQPPMCIICHVNVVAAYLIAAATYVGT